MTLDRAIKIACEAHAGQTDRARQSYILHPLRVMLAMPNDEYARTVAVLHDVIEDAPEYAAAIDQLLGRDELKALYALTKKRSESYDDYIARVMTNPLAVKVKIADLKDNLDPTRIANPSNYDNERAEKYRAALARLEAIAS